MSLINNLSYNILCNILIYNLPMCIAYKIDVTQRLVRYAFEKTNIIRKFV